MFDNLCNFVKKELTDLDHRITANGKLTMQEIQYADLLTHFKKNLLTADAMEGSGESYSDGYNRTIMMDILKGIVKDIQKATKNPKTAITQNQAPDMAHVVGVKAQGVTAWEDTLTDILTIIRNIGAEKT